MSPRRVAVAVVACTDTRLDPEVALGLSAEQAEVVRTDRGAVTAAALELLVEACHAHPIDQIVVLHHTDCSGAGSGLDVETQAQLALAEDLATIARSRAVPSRVGVRGIHWDLEAAEPMIELEYQR